MILMSCSASQPPITPRAPNSSTNTRPLITGDTLNGRSMRVISRFLPGKRYLAISQAAATPNTVFSGTTIAAVSKVRPMAWRVSSCHSRLRYSPSPFSSAWANTEASGSTTTTARNASPSPIRM